jgi:hypothetical protein
VSLRKSIAVIAKLKEQGVLEEYAISGAVAALNYIEPFLTADLDILISVGDLESRKSGLVLLKPIEEALAKMGYRERSDVGIMIERWPVQFLPVASPLDEEALNRAVAIDVAAPGEAPFKARCLSAEHLIATAVKVGRPKDWARVSEFLEQKSLDLEMLRDVLDRHGLLAAWASFCARAAIKNPLR